MNGDDREDFSNFLRDLDERTSSILREDAIIQQTASIMRNDDVLRRQLLLQHEQEQQQRRQSLLHQRMFQQLPTPIVHPQIPNFGPPMLPNSVLQTMNLERLQPSILNRDPGAATMNNNAHFAHMHQQQPRATPQLQNSVVAPSAAALATNQRTGFPYVLFDLLNVNLYSQVVRWSKDGQAFYVDLDHPDFTVVLHGIFKCEYFVDLKFQILVICCIHIQTFCVCSFDSLSFAAASFRLLKNNSPKFITVAQCTQGSWLEEAHGGTV